MPLFTTPGASLGGVPGSTALARLLVVISGNSSGLSSALGNATTSLSGFQSTAGQLGSVLTRSVTLPVLAIGGAAIKTAMDFETAWTQVSSLTTIAAKDIDSFREKILELSASDKITAGPTELAHALYFAGSAGLTSAQALDVTRLSAEGASVGLGEAGDIARVLIGALNAFADQGLTAASAMDSLTGAVKAGTAEPADLAVSLGRLLPIADQVGLSFNEVVAQVAALTNVGVPARVATTSLRALFGQFLAPTQKAAENLHALGISYNELSDAIHAGPLIAFKMLNDAAGGNQQIIRDLIPQIRGLTAFYALSGHRADDAAKALNLVRNSAGSLDRVLAQFEQTSAFKFKNAMNNLQVAAIEFGAVLLPVFNQGLSIVGDFGKALQAIPPGMKTLLVTVLGVGAAMGPLLKIFASLSTASGVFLGSLGTAARGFTLFAASAALATGTLTGFVKGTGSFLSFGVGLISMFAALATGLGLVRTATMSMNAAFQASGRAIPTLSLLFGTLSGGEIGLIAAGLTAVAGAIIFMIRQAHELEHAMENLQNSAADAAAGGVSWQSFINDLKVPDRVKADLLNVAIQIGAVNKAVDELTLQQGMTQLGAEMDSVFKHLDEDLAGTSQSIHQFAPAFADMANSGVSAVDALISRGHTLDELLNTLGDINTSAVSGPSVDIGGEADELARLTRERQTLSEALSQYQDQQAAQILLNISEQNSIQDLADKYGVSIDTVKAKLSEFGTTATGLDTSSEKMLAQQANWIDKTTGAIIGAQTEMKAAEAEIIAKRQDSIRSAIDFWHGLDNITKASSDKIVTNIEKVASAQVHFAENVRSLSGRIGPGALQALVDKGPEAVGRFVKLSNKQLQAWEYNFALAMGAGDAVVLNEGKHLETKGNAMIANFATAILSNKHLSGGAAREIMASVQAALDTGKLKPKGVELIQHFAEGIAAAKQVPKDKVAGIVAAVVNRVSNNPQFFASGQKTVQQFAAGIASKYNLPKGAMNQIILGIKTAQATVGVEATKKGGEFVSKFAAGARAKKNEPVQVATTIADAVKQEFTLTLTPQGLEVATSFATGITSGSGIVSNAVTTLVTNAKLAAELAAHGSPNYFSYYLGQGIVAQFGEGLSAGTIPARALVNKVDSLRAQITDTSQFFDAGRDSMIAFGDGITGQAGIPISAITQLLTDVANSQNILSGPFSSIGESAALSIGTGIENTKLQTGLFSGLAIQLQNSLSIDLSPQGKQTAESLAAGILTNSNLSTDAAISIIADVQRGLANNTLSPQGVQMIQSFTQGIASSSTIPADEVANIVDSVITAVQKDPHFFDYGKRTIVQFASGISSALGLPVGAMTQIVQAIQQAQAAVGSASVAAGRDAVVGLANGAKGAREQAVGQFRDIVRGVHDTTALDLSAQGRRGGQTFAAGLQSSSSDVTKATGTVLDGSIITLDQSAKALFTFALGQQIVQRFGDGIASSTGIPTDAIGAVVTATIAKMSDDPAFFNSGRKGIAQFAQGLASNLQLPAGAIGQLTTLIQSIETQVVAQATKAGVNTMVGFASGAKGAREQAVGAFAGLSGEISQGLNTNLTSQGASAIRTFAAGIAEAQGLPREQMNQAVSLMILRLRKNPEFFRSGRDDMQRFAQGLASQTGLPVSAMQAIIAAVVQAQQTASTGAAAAGQKAVTSFASGARGAKERAASEFSSLAAAAQSRVHIDLRSEGFFVGQSFASGISSSSGVVTGAINLLVGNAKRAAEKAAQNSPRYFTFYLGGRIADEFTEGLNKTQADSGLVSGFADEVLSNKGKTEDAAQELVKSVRDNMDLDLTKQGEHAGDSLVKALQSNKRRVDRASKELITPPRRLVLRPRGLPARPIEPPKLQKRPRLRLRPNVTPRALRRPRGLPLTPNITPKPVKQPRITTVKGRRLKRVRNVTPTKPREKRQRTLPTAPVVTRPKRKKPLPTTPPRIRDKKVVPVSIVSTKVRKRKSLPVILTPPKPQPKLPPVVIGRTPQLKRPRGLPLKENLTPNYEPPHTHRPTQQKQPRDVHRILPLPQHPPINFGDELKRNANFLRPPIHIHNQADKGTEPVQSKPDVHFHVNVNGGSSDPDKVGKSVSRYIMQGIRDGNWLD